MLFISHLFTLFLFIFSTSLPFIGEIKFPTTALCYTFCFCPRIISLTHRCSRNPTDFSHLLPLLRFPSVGTFFTRSLSPHIWLSHPHHGHNVWNSHFGLLWVCIGLISLFLKCPSGSFFYICFSPYVLLPRVFSMWLLRWDQKFYPTCLRNPPACIPVGILKFVF